MVIVMIRVYFQLLDSDGHGCGEKMVGVAFGRRRGMAGVLLITLLLPGLLEGTGWTSMPEVRS